MFKRDSLVIVLEDPHVLFSGVTSGRIVRGHVLLTIHTAVKIKTIDLSFEGVVSINGKENGTIHFRNTLISKGWQFLGLTGEPRIFYHGLYKYHFEFFLDRNLPNSVFTKHGYIQYTFYAKVNKAGFRRDLHDTKILHVLHSMPMETEQALVKTGELETKLRFYILAPSSRYRLEDEIPVRIGIKPLIEGIRIIKITIVLNEEVKYRTYNGWSSTYSQQITSTSSIWTVTRSDLLEQTLRLHIPNSDRVQLDCSTIFFQIKHTLDVIINLADEDQSRKVIVIRIPVHLSTCFPEYDRDLPSYEQILIMPPEYAIVDVCPPYQSTVG